MKPSLPHSDELAAFFRTRRERLRPEDVGIEGGHRRRTPGLRREEVAQLAGIGVTWYTWLEQGRDVRPSPRVAEALANALRLTQLERAHLHTLLHRRESEEPASHPKHLELLASQLAFPAYVRDHAWDMLFWNEAATAFFGDFGPVRNNKTNLLYFIFLNEKARRVFVDWPAVADRSVAQYRRLHGGSPAHSRANHVIEELRRESPDFASCWERFIVTEFFIGQRILRDPAGVESAFTYATLTSPDASSPWVTVYLPAASDASAADADRHGWPGQARP